MMRTAQHDPPMPEAAAAGQCAGCVAACLALDRGEARGDCRALVVLAQAAAVSWGDAEAPHGWWAEDGYPFIDAFVRAYEAVWDAAAAAEV
jgi:hypothetical protein